MGRYKMLMAYLAFWLLKLINLGKISSKGKNFFWSGDVSLSEGGRMVLEKGNGFMKGYDINIKKGELVIGTHNFFNRNLKIACLDRITIGSDCAFGDSVQIYDHDHTFAAKEVKFRSQGYSTKPVRIGNNVWVGARAIILKGVDIGDNCVIGAGAVVTKSIPANSIAVGVPTKVIKTRN